MNRLPHCTGGCLQSRARCDCLTGTTEIACSHSPVYEDGERPPNVRPYAISPAITVVRLMHRPLRQRVVDALWAAFAAVHGQPDHLEMK